MAKLYLSADCDDGRTATTRCGHSSITCHVRGWDAGIRVRVFVDDEGDVRYYVTRTGGSNSIGDVEVLADSARDAIA